MVTAAVTITNGQIYVTVRPTAPVVVRPVAPSPRHIWIDGEWGYTGGRYVYTNGYWGLPRYTGAVWVPGHWKNTLRRGWIWRPGHWRRG